MIKFKDLDLALPIQRVLKEIGYETPTPIQQQAIPFVLNGHDLLGIAQTGTGKTAAFCLPIIDLLEKAGQRREPKSAKALILTPTRELAVQIHQNLVAYGRHFDQKYSVIFGGVSQNPQVKDLSRGTDVLVATPGRLLDLIQQKHVRIDKIKFFVLDEADRMLDMGFLPDIKRMLKMVPNKRHNLFFSATMPKEIQSLANTILDNPKKVEVTPAATTVEKISQSVMFVEKKNKINLLIHLLEASKTKKPNSDKTLVFVEMKHVANRVAEKLIGSGIAAAAIHGNKSQGARQRAIQDFTSGKIKVLIATDIASRGIDIDGVSHVINFELSRFAESYVHRIGRTARAGAEGIAISFVTSEEKSYLANVERTTKQTIEVNTDQPYHSEKAANATTTSVGKAKAKIEGQRGDKRRSFKKKSRPKNFRGNKKTSGVRNKKTTSGRGKSVTK